jgi:protocatechuate 3,4-dioxygenase beta subunit
LFGRITSAKGEPLPGAQVTVWQTAADGRYDIQTDASTMDCRGVFTTDAEGRYLLRTVRPLGYYIPLDGPVGGMVQAQKRHGMRPAHIHFLIGAPGYRELTTALYIAGDEHLEDDVVFGAAGDLVAEIKANNPACPIKGLPSVQFDFSLSRESVADKLSGRVGADPGQITAGDVTTEKPYGSPPPDVTAEAETKKGGILAGLFRSR